MHVIFQRFTILTSGNIQTFFGFSTSPLPSTIFLCLQHVSCITPAQSPPPTFESYVLYATQLTTALEYFELVQSSANCCSITLIEFVLMCLRIHKRNPYSIRSSTTLTWPVNYNRISQLKALKAVQLYNSNYCLKMLLYVFQENEPQTWTITDFFAHKGLYLGKNTISTCSCVGYLWITHKIKIGDAHWDIQITLWRNEFWSCI